MKVLAFATGALLSLLIQPILKLILWQGARQEDVRMWVTHSSTVWECLEREAQERE